MYTYAFLRHLDNSFPLPNGMSGSLKLVGTEGIDALVEPDLDFEAIQQNDDRLMQAVLSYDRILREVFQQTTLLPLRFGTRFVSEQGLLAHLQARQTEYLEKLDKLAGQAEYTLKLSPIEVLESPSISNDVRGKDYFLAKKQRYQTQVDQKQVRQEEFEQLQGTVAQQFARFVVAESKDGIERIYLLSDRQQEPWLLQCLETWQSQCPHWQISLAEALPPYHFV